MRSNYWLFFIFLCMSTPFWQNVPPIQAQADEPSPIEYEFFSDTGITLAELSAGTFGSGTLRITHTAYEQNLTKIIIQLSNDSEGAHALVYDNAEQTISRALNWLEEQEAIDAVRSPAIEMHAPDGWWVRDGVVNYNLDIVLNGAITAMWNAGSRDDPEQAGWLNALPANSIDPTTRIQVRDPQQEGHPLWDLRQIIPPFPGEGYLRTNYAERQCAPAASVAATVVPEWPYITPEPIGDGFEQPPEQFVSPIVIDWSRGIVTNFSELVTVRNQSCSYSLYSIRALVEGEVNQPNFETPFAFYDLSGENNGYPNLILRTEHFAAREPWSLGLRADNQGRRLTPDPFQTIRYSWLTESGRTEWEYKVEVMGTYPYTETTSIAGDRYEIKAPDYDSFPEWVLEREWPVITFVDVERGPYRSTEGIYDWSPRETGIGHLYGWAPIPETAFNTIGTGLRGEYRFEQAGDVRLYHSPIDQRLHLLGADGGLWQVDNETVLKLHNLDDDPYIDGWETLQDEEPREALYVSHDHIIFGDGEGVVIRAASVPDSNYEIDPPSSAETWQAFKQKHDALQKQNPLSMHTWLRPFPGAETDISGVALSQFRATPDGFRFVLTPKDSVEINENALLPDIAWDSRQLVVSYSPAGFEVSEGSPPELSLAINAIDATTWRNRIPVYIEGYNTGSQDAERLYLTISAKRNGEEKWLSTDSVTLLAGDTHQKMLTWQPLDTGAWTIRARLNDVVDDTLITEQTHSIQVTSQLEETSIHQDLRPKLGGAVFITALIGLLGLGVATRLAVSGNVDVE